MPCERKAIETLEQAGVLFGPGKAANAGGVAVSGLEMSQNSMRLKWTKEEVDAKLRTIMSDIHSSCVRYGKNSFSGKGDGTHANVNYVQGANVAGFIKVAEAMVAHGRCLEGKSRAWCRGIKRKRWRDNNAGRGVKG